MVTLTTVLTSDADTYALSINAPVFSVDNEVVNTGLRVGHTLMVTRKPWGFGGCVNVVGVHPNICYLGYSSMVIVRNGTR